MYLKIWEQSSRSMWCERSLTHYHSLPVFLTLIVKMYRSRKSKRACQGAKVETGAVDSGCKIRLRRTNLYANALVWICRSSISAHSHVASLGGLFGVGGGGEESTLNWWCHCDKWQHPSHAGWIPPNFAPDVHLVHSRTVNITLLWRSANLILVSEKPYVVM